MSGVGSTIVGAIKAGLAFKRQLLDGFPPNSSYSSFITGRRPPGYVGSPQDASGAGGNFDIRTGLTGANAWANSGYVSTIAAVGGGFSIAKDKMAFDMDTQGLLLAFTVNMAVPGASASIMGNGNGSTVHGVYLSVRTSGKIRVVLATASGGVTGLSDSVTTVADGADHQVIIAIDGPTKTIILWVDGQIDTIYYSAYRGVATITSNWNIGAFGGNSDTLTSVVTKLANFHALIFAGGLPGNYGQLAWRLYRNPGVPLSLGDAIARKKTVIASIDGQSNERGAGDTGSWSGDYGYPTFDTGAGPPSPPRSMWPGLVARAGKRGAWLNVCNAALGSTSQAHSWTGILRAWTTSMLVTRGTYVLNAGKVYKNTGIASTVFASTTAPVHSSGTVTGADGLVWTYMAAARAQDVAGYVYPYTDAYFDPNGYLALCLAGVQPLLRAHFASISVRRGQYVLANGNVYRSDYLDDTIFPSTTAPSHTSGTVTLDSIPWAYLGAARAQDVAGYIYPSTDAYAALQNYGTRIVLISIGQGDKTLSTTRAEYAQALINAADYFLANGVKVAIGFTCYAATAGAEAYYQSDLLPGWQDALDHFDGNANVIAGANLRTALGVLAVTPAAGAGLKSDNLHMNNAAYSLAEAAWDAALGAGGIF